MAQAALSGVKNMAGSDDRSSAGSRRDDRNRNEFQASVARLEQAVQDLVGSATSEFSDRASTLVDDITSKFEREFKSSDISGSGSDRSQEDADGYGFGLDEDLSRDDGFSDSSSIEEDIRDPGGAAQRMRRRRRQRRRHPPQTRIRSTNLYRDPDNEKIVGVCAGVANYYGMEAWVVRCMAVTGLLFLPSIVFPAYWVAYFVMDKPPSGPQSRRSRRSGKRGIETPELGTSLAPRQNLRNVEADLTEAELRLRRMESHVTSGRYELQKELNRIDPESPVSQSGNGSGSNQ
jgi:phage shock protein C